MKKTELIMSIGPLSKNGTGVSFSKTPSGRLEVVLWSTAGRMRAYISKADFKKLLKWYK